MSLKTGFALLIGLVAGMGLAAELQTQAHARKATALQVTSCAKADRADVR